MIMTDIISILSGTILCPISFLPLASNCFTQRMQKFLAAKVFLHHLLASLGLSCSLVSYIICIIIAAEVIGNNAQRGILIHTLLFGHHYPLPGSSASLHI